MLISNSTNQSPINDTEDINIHSSNDEKWAGNYFSPYQISRKGFICVVNIHSIISFFFKNGASFIQIFSQVIILGLIQRHHKVQHLPHLHRQQLKE